ncbi:hypothetical protein, conserved [Babesia bigemina]|uniref:Uncharacterized protein n=1 Tax=Babesia bigemina TaxID=5866 RepID=A0A061CZ04_BABBI|nr:hypothetical protein, conserved [Babesia bigemina]CDR93683.1 hypothetical protein, conserved [Babesia bigemina]|eukprot:XP_012765869.1 hypothetical protein, conserved [Babesia bigemina]
MSQAAPVSWLKGIWPRQTEDNQVPKCDTPIVVHYTRYWLPPPIEPSEDSEGDADVAVAVEVVLEPYVLWCCLLRSVTGCKLRFSPSLYDEFVGGAMPAAFVGDSACYGGAPLRQESLLSHLLLNLPTASAEVLEQLSSRFALYEAFKKPDGSAKITSDSQFYHSASSILPVYVEKHLRYAVLFFIWVFPKISQNVTKRIVVNSTPWPYGYYVFNKRSKEIARTCAQCGYSDIAFTIKELALMLRELQRILQNDAPSLNHSAGPVTGWKAPYSQISRYSSAYRATVGYAFTKTDITHSGVEELLALHREFYDLKSYCAVVNRTYNVADLPPPYLCGNTFPVSYFVKEPSACMALLGSVWEHIKSIPQLTIMQ